MRMHQALRFGFPTRSILCVAASLGLAQSASAAWLWPEQSPPIHRAQYFSRLIHPSVVAGILYQRYGMARVLYVQQRGDVYYADALDRNGYRLSFAVDGYNGRVLESFFTRPNSFAAVPRGDEWGRDIAPRQRRELASRGDDEIEAKPRPAQKRERAGRDVASRQSPAEPIEKERPAPIKKDKPPKAAARAVPPEAIEQPRPEMGPPAPAPRPVRPAAASPEAPSAAEPARPAGPVARVPEPLIDPRTGKRNTSSIAVPPAPLDDASSSGRTKPTAAVPPAPLE